MHNNLNKYLDDIFTHSFLLRYSEMKEEFYYHLEESEEYYLSLGYSEEDAPLMAIKSFGQLHDIQKELINYKKYRLLGYSKKIHWILTSIAFISFVLSFSYQLPSAITSINIWHFIKGVFLISVIALGINLYVQKEVKKPYSRYK